MWYTVQACSSILPTNDSCQHSTLSLLHARTKRAKYAINLGYRQSINLLEIIFYNKYLQNFKVKLQIACHWQLVECL
jgi:hypothetical protein